MANKEFPAQSSPQFRNKNITERVARVEKKNTLNESIERIHLERFIRDDRREPRKFAPSRQARTVARELRRRDALCNAFAQTENRNY